MPWTPDQMILDFVSALQKGNGGTVSIGYRPESGTEQDRQPAQWEMWCTTGGSVRSDTRKVGAIGASFEECMDKLLASMNMNGLV